MPQPIILDCDPGHDDAVAIMLALANPEKLEVLGITTTYGNVGLERTTHNARVVRELCGTTTEIYPGAAGPLVRNTIHAESVHGKSGLEGPDLPEPTQASNETHAVQFMIESIMQRPGEITLVPVGPLTNLALAMRLEPRIVPRIKEIVLMGGSTTLGNWSPAAEFNILCDPHAARVVFEAGIPLVMFGLNVTHQVLATPARTAHMRALPNRAGNITAELMDFFKLAYERRYHFDGPALHDVCCIAHLLQPELFTLQTMHVAVDTNEGPSFGRTVCDVYGATNLPPNAQVAMHANSDALFELLTSSLARLP